MFRFLGINVLLILALTSVALSRTWRSRAGNFSVEAELVDVRSGNVVLKQEDGTVIEFPLEKLSLADVRYVQQAFKEAEAAIGQTAKPEPPSQATKPMAMPGPPTDVSTGDASSTHTVQPATEPPLAKPGVGGWQFTVDPPSERLEFPENIKLSIPIQFGMGRSLIMPTRRSPFVLIRTGGPFDKRQELWDLRTATRVTALTTGDRMVGLSALSPDGRFFATTPMHKGVIQLWSLKKGHVAQEFKLSHWAARVHFIDFAGPSRLVASLDRSEQIAIWNIETGAKIASYSTNDLPSERYQYAISPGGHYIGFPEGGVIRLVDVRNGVVAGELIPPGATGVWALKVGSLSFSPDGQELAGLFADGSGSAIVVWNLADAKQVVNHRFKKRLRDAIAGARLYKGRPLEWFPDRQAWLVYGRGIVDRKIGSLVWTEPAPKDGYLPAEPRLLIDDQRLVAMVGTRTSPRLEIVPLSAEEIAASTKLVASGATAKDVGLPLITIADWSAVKNVTLERQPNDWTYQSKARYDGKPLLTQPIDVDARNTNVRNLFFSDRVTAKVLVASKNPARGPSVGVRTGLQMDRFDLASHDRDARFEVPFATELIDFSPDGDMMLFRIRSDEDRLDVWSIIDGKHVAGFRPYQDKAVEEQKVTWAAFVNAERVLTMNGNGKLTGWKLPECRAVYTLVIAPQTAISFNSSRDRLAVYNANEIHFLDPGTGACTGTLPAPRLKGEYDVTAMAFRPDDQSLAALVTNAGTPFFVSWDLSTGKLAAQFPLSKGGTGVTWAGDRYVLVHEDATHVLLVDLEIEAIVWKYNLPFGCNSQSSPDGRHWFVGGDNSAGHAHLAALDLPSEETAKLISKSPGFEPVIGQGTPVTLQVTVDKPPQAKKWEPMKTEITAIIAKAMTNNGIRMVPNAALTLNVSLNDRPTGKTTTFRRMGFGFGYVAVPVSKLEAKVDFVSGNGYSYWTKQATFKTGRQMSFIERIPSNINTATYVRMKQWRAAMDWFKALTIPPRIYPKEIVEGLGESQLTPKGAVRQRTVKELPPKPAPKVPNGKVVDTTAALLKLTT